MNPRLNELCERYPVLAPYSAQVEAAFDLLQDTFADKGKLLICGNGGSAADSDHMAAELLKGFGHSRPLSPGWEARLDASLTGKLQGALPAIPLPCFNALLSAYANDCDPVYSFAQLTWALGRPGDALLCISTSGNSENIIQAARAARGIGIKTLGLSGKSGGRLKSEVEHCICVPETEVCKIQELHLPVYHCLCFMLEDVFFPR